MGQSEVSCFPVFHRNIDILSTFYFFSYSSIGRATAAFPISREPTSQNVIPTVSLSRRLILICAVFYMLKMHGTPEYPPYSYTPGRSFSLDVYRKNGGHRDSISAGYVQLFSIILWICCLISIHFVTGVPNVSSNFIESCA